VRMGMCCKQHIHASATKPPHEITWPENQLAGDTGLDSGHNASSYINTAQRFSPIHEKKGCDLLVQAFAKLASEEPDVDVVIAGPDQVACNRSCRRCAFGSVFLSAFTGPGRWRGDLKWGALRACEAFILPSHQENFGIAVVESLAAGRPGLISNQVNIW